MEYKNRLTNITSATIVYFGAELGKVKGCDIILIYGRLAMTVALRYTRSVTLHVDSAR